MIGKLRKRLQGGHVLRYHTRPEISHGQTVADHTCRVLTIVTTLWPDISREAILYILYHDVAESELGDLPATTKWNYPKLAEAYKQAEMKYETLIDVPVMFKQLSGEEKNIVKMADMLELVLHCKRQLQMGNELAFEVYMNGVNYLKDNFADCDEYTPVKKILKELANAR